MTQRTYFWISVGVSIAAVFSLGAFSAKRHLGSLLQGNIFEGIPAMEFKTTLNDLTSKTASSVSAFQEIIEGQFEN